MEKKKLTKEEQMVKDAWEFINCQVNAIKQRDKKFTSLGNEIGIHYQKKEIHIYGLIKLSELTGITYNRIDWDGNKSCDANYDEVFFIYKGVRFFQLVDKEDDNEGK